MSQSVSLSSTGHVDPHAVPGSTPTDYGFARRRMVDTQVRPVQVSDPRILEAMREIPREHFVPADRAPLAYMDQDVALGGGRYLTEPRVIARLVQSLAPRGGEKALVIASATGYAACLLSALGVSVVALEQDAALDAQGIVVTRSLAPAIMHRQGAFAAGWPDEAPYDMILIDGAVREIPAALAAQLGPKGRLACVLAVEGRVATAVLAEASVHGLRSRPQFDAATPLIPELIPAPQFKF